MIDRRTIAPFVQRVGFGAAVAVAVAAQVGSVLMGISSQTDGGWRTSGHTMARSLLEVVVVVVLGLVLAGHHQSIQRLRTSNAALRDANERLADQGLLQQDLLLAEERARSARYLHDGLGRQLTAVASTIDAATHSRNSRPEQSRPQLMAARDLLGSALRDVRTWARAMNPVNSGRPDGLAGLRSMADSFAGTELRVHLDLPGGQPAIGDRQELFVGRLVQEGIANALRHGGAANVWVHLAFQGDDFVIELADDGCQATPGQEGFALRTLRLRADELGGQLHLGNGRTGFRMRAILPVEDGKHT